MRNMKLTLASFFSLVLATKADWDCDQRCPGYNACVQQNKNNRGRLLEDDLSLIEDIYGNATWPIHHATKDSTVMSSSLSNLRGSNLNSRRRLDLLLTFQLQLYWEEGACWQEEWRKREWCLQCKGGSCNTDDYLILAECSGSSKQRFIYKQVSGSGGGKFMPVTRPDLCWTRTRVNAHQLRPCGDGYKDDQGRDVQIIVGFDPFEASELHPNGVPDKCMDNHHHPKAEELIRAGKCDEARRNKTNKWLPINKSSVELDASPPPVETVPSAKTEQDGDGLPPVQALGSEYCDEHLCGMCQGDCDNDSQCAGDLKCFQRDSGEPVPGCAGGHESMSKTDYCYDPNFARVDTIPAGGDEELEIDPLGSNYCTRDQPCTECQGDCDDDEDCAGELICHQRGKNDDVPGCRGGHNDDSKTDYCVKP